MNGEKLLAAEDLETGGAAKASVGLDVAAVELDVLVVLELGRVQLLTAAYLNNNIYEIRHFLKK